jgi:hypothetical protein
MYNFNPELPDIQIAHKRLFYQTTELAGKLSVASEDFGKSHFFMGVLNLKNHNPTSTGLNWSCEEIYHNSSTLSSPTARVVMAETDVSGFSATSQINVSLGRMDLAYGNNYVTSYTGNGEFAEPPISCSTTKIVLEDFPYFEALPLHGEAPNTAGVREFSGGFTHLGFFEPEATVYRGPAGSSSTSVSSQELKTGMFGVFY